MKNNVKLSVVVCGRWSNKPCLVVSPIKGYTEIKGDQKNTFLCDDPVIYEELDGRMFSASIHDIVYADYTASRGNIGNAYKIPRENITPIV